MDPKNIENHIVSWLTSYLKKSGLKGFVIGVSGGVDSAVTSTLCAKTGFPTLVLNMPILQKANQFDRSNDHINWLKKNFNNVSSDEVDLTSVFQSFETLLPSQVQDHLTMANLRARIRMSTLYVYASNHNKLVVGTGNKVEDFGVGFYTKYGDGGVDISPIADCNKTEVWQLGKELGILKEIIDAPPTDGLWDDGRTDEGQLGFKYQDLEDAMKNPNSPHRKEYEKIRKQNLHKMEPIPVCKIPS